MPGVALAGNHGCTHKSAEFAGAVPKYDRQSREELLRGVESDARTCEDMTSRELGLSAPETTTYLRSAESLGECMRLTMWTWDCDKRAATRAGKRRYAKERLASVTNRIHDRELPGRGRTDLLKAGRLTQIPLFCQHERRSARYHDEPQPSGTHPYRSIPFSQGGPDRFGLVCSASMQFYMAVHCYCVINATIPSKSLGPGQTAANNLFSPAEIFEAFLQRSEETIAVIRVDVASRVTAHLNEAGAIGDDHRNSAGHCLHRREAKALVHRRVGKQECARVEHGQFGFRDEPKMAQPAFGNGIPKIVVDLLVHPTAAARKHQRKFVPQPARKSPPCPKKLADLFSWFERRNTKSVAAGLETEPVERSLNLVLVAWSEIVAHAKCYRRYASRRDAERFRQLRPDRLGVGDDVRRLLQRSGEKAFELVDTLRRMRLWIMEDGEVVHRKDAAFHSHGKEVIRPVNDAGAQRPPSPPPASRSHEPLAAIDRLSAQHLGWIVDRSSVCKIAHG